MGAFRQEMREARATLHEYLSVPAIYFEPPYNPLTTVVKEVTVRVHEKWIALGDLKGTNFNYAEIEAVAPRIVFMLSEVKPERGFVVSLEAGLAFKIDTPLEPDDITQTVTALKMRKDQSVGFPVPEGS